MNDFEKDTVSKMIRIYCRKKHTGTEILCSECRKLEEYALDRLEKCPFGENKPNCKDCDIHCYKREMKDEIIRVMRYSGPLMIFRYPLHALIYLFKKHSRNKKG